MSYFGILRAGATVVPVDPELSVQEVVNIARRAEATVCLVSEETAQSLSGLTQALAEAGLATQVHSLAQAMEGDPAYPDAIAPLRKTAAADDVASLIFTSGTTGNAEGRDAHPPQLHLAGGEARGVFDLGVRRRAALGAAAAPHLRVLRAAC